MPCDTGFTARHRCVHRPVCWRRDPLALGPLPDKLAFALCSQVAPSLAINYCAYETLRSYWLSFQPDLKAPTVAMSLLCGSFAGLISSTATFPLDLARRRLQLEGQVRLCCRSFSPGLLTQG